MRRPSMVAVVVAACLTLDPGGAARAAPRVTSGNATPAVSAGTGHVERPARADLSGLVAGTTYHYRLVATNDAGTSNGQDRQFATPTA